MKKENLSILMARLIMVVSFIVGIGAVLGMMGYLWTISENKVEINNENVKEKVKDETADWKTYRNEEYGFEFKYPKELSFLSTGPNEVQKELDKDSEKQLSGTISPFFDTIIFSEKESNDIFKFSIFYSKEEILSKDNYIEEYFYLYGLCDVRFDFEPINVDILNINRNNVLEVKGTNNEKSIYRGCYYFKNYNNNLIVFSSESTKEKELFEETDLAMKEILSTLLIFQKEKKDETADWKIYRNEEVGFEFEYPEDVLLKTDFTNENVNSESNLYISVRKMSEVIDEPMSFTKERLLKERNALINSDSSYSYLSSNVFYDAIINNFGILGAKYTTFRELEVCNIQFTREANIYVGDYYIYLRWYYENVDEIVYNNLDYFVSGGVNCNDDYKMWNLEDGTENFYNDLLAGKTDSISQRWFNDFEAVLSTIKSIEIDKTANWKTYRNEEYGVEFQYPSEYIIKDRKETYHKNSERSFGFYMNQNNVNIPNLDIVVYKKNDKEMSIEDYAKDYLGVDNLLFTESGNLVSNNIKSVKITNQVNDFGMATNTICRLYCFSSESNIFDFVLFQDWTVDEKGKSNYDIDANYHVKLATDVFSTFKFID